MKKMFLIVAIVATAITLNGCDSISSAIADFRHNEEAKKFREKFPADVSMINALKNISICADDFQDASKASACRSALSGFQSMGLVGLSEDGAYIRSEFINVFSEKVAIFEKISKGKAFGKASGFDAFIKGLEAGPEIVFSPEKIFEAEKGNKLRIDSLARSASIFVDRYAYH